jgi:hypothetical protein
MKKTGAAKTFICSPRAHQLGSFAVPFWTPEIRIVMRHALGCAFSNRTIKRLAKSKPLVVPETSLSNGSGDTA